MKTQILLVWDKSSLSICVKGVKCPLHGAPLLWHKHPEPRPAPHLQSLQAPTGQLFGSPLDQQKCEKRKCVSPEAAFLPSFRVHLFLRLSSLLTCLSASTQVQLPSNISAAAVPRALPFLLQH